MAWGVAQPRWRAQTPVMGARPRRRCKWSRNNEATVVRTHPRRDLFTAERNLLPCGTNHGDRRESECTVHRRRSYLILGYFSTVSSEILFRASVWLICRTHISDFCVRMCWSFCNKFVAQQSVFNSTIETILNRALNPTQTWSQSLASGTGGHVSVLKIDSQPNFALILL
jgi:hypothetical protein